jgi:hypothetical protein
VVAAVVVEDLEADSAVGDLVVEEPAEAGDARVMPGRNAVRA